MRKKLHYDYYYNTSQKLLLFPIISQYERKGERVRVYILHEASKLPTTRIGWSIAMYYS